MPSEAPTGEDIRVWIGHLAPGNEAEHERFIVWLNSPDAHEVFRRRRLTEYTLTQNADKLTVVFKAPHTGDPRIMIDFLRYPGVWPDFWQFDQAGHDAGAASEPGEIRAHWRRPEVT